MSGPARTETPCPGCGAAGRVRVYEAAGVPVQACTAPGATREEALGAPRGDIRLACCPACGLVTNEAYAAGEVHADEVAATAARLGETARELVEVWGIRKRTIIEVGCGDAAFLRALCEAGENLGIGIDPDAPVAPPGEGPVQLLREAYADRHAWLPADVVVCRSLLQQLPDLHAFLTRVRLSLRSGHPGLAYFEVPDARSALEAGVPWEVHYDRCAYFSPVSLTRLFERARFDVQALAQRRRCRHLSLIARVIADEGSDEARAPRTDVEPDADLLSLAADFAARARPRVNRWRTELEAARGVRKVVLWGAGGATSSFLSAVGEQAGRAVERVVDVDPRKRGARMAGSGQEVVAPEDLRQRPPDVVVVLDELRLDEVRRDLKRLGLTPAVVAA